MPAHQGDRTLVQHLRDVQEILARSRQYRTDVVVQERALRQLDATLEHVSAAAAGRPDTAAQAVALRGLLAALRCTARSASVALSVEQSRIVHAQAALALQYADHVHTEVLRSRRARLRVL